MVGRGGSWESIGAAATSSIGKGVVEVALVEGKARLKVVVILKYVCKQATQDNEDGPEGLPPRWGRAGPM